MSFAHFDFNIYKNRIQYIFLQGCWDPNKLGYVKPQRCASTLEWLHERQLLFLLLTRDTSSHINGHYNCHGKSNIDGDNSSKESSTEDSLGDRATSKDLEWEEAQVSGKIHCQWQWKVAWARNMFQASAWIGLPLTSRKSNYNDPARHRQQNGDPKAVLGLQMSFAGPAALTFFPHLSIG